MSGEADEALGDASTMFDGPAAEASTWRAAVFRKKTWSIPTKLAQSHKFLLSRFYLFGGLGKNSRRGRYILMHPNQEIIQRFFHCFAEGDYLGMQQCLHADIEFSDIGFDLRGKQVGAMWHMICAKGTQVMFRNVQADDSQGTAHWECHYDFQKDEGSKSHSVHNIIEARFRFEDALIREHHDSCGFERWARQALGLVGIVLGETEFLHKQVRESAKTKLEKFIAEHPDYA